MKSRVITAISLLALTSATYANPTNRFFGRAAYARTFYTYKQFANVGTGIQIPTDGFKKDNNALELSAGYKWHNFGAQFSVMGMENIKYTGPANAYSIKQESYNFAADMLFFIPVWKTIEVKGLLGVGVLDTKYETNIIGNSNEFTKRSTGIGARVGAGLQYNFTNHFAADIMVTYQAPGNDSIKNFLGASIGLILYI